MKSIFRSLLPLLLLLAFTGCESGPIESLTFQSPDGDRTIKVTGKRNTSLGPILTTVTLVVPKGEKSFTFQHQAGSLTSENVKAEWENNNNCKLTFTLDDGDSWEVECYLLDDRVEAVKNFKIDGKGIFN
ncbi:MAG: hypothetical protein AAGN35_26455 [Bacteroidota bacterium]